MCEKLGQPLFETNSDPVEVRTRVPKTLPKEEEDRIPVVAPVAPDCVPITTTSPHTASTGDRPPDPFEKPAPPSTG